MLKTLEVKGGPLQYPLVDDPPEDGLWFPPGWYGDLWYPQGLYYPQAVSWKPSPSPKVELNPGDTLRINLTLQYRGPAQTRTFYAALVANRTSGWFEEWSGGYNATKDIDLPARTTLGTITGKYIDIVIPIDPFFEHSGEDGAVYVKIMDGITFTEGENITPYYYDAVHIIAAEGEFANFAIASLAKV